MGFLDDIRAEHQDRLESGTIRGVTVERTFPPVWRCRECGQESTRLSDMRCHHDGQKLCAYCATPLPPTQLRRKYCPGGKCARAVYIICIPQFQRDVVFGRDKGVCCMCGLDTEKFSRVVKHASSRTRRDPLSGGGRGAILGHLGLKPDDIGWHMDHIKPVSEGGGYRPGITPDEVLANLRTLCTPCHKQVTREWHQARASAGRSPGQMQLF